MTKGFALVKGSKVEVLVGKTLIEAVGIAQRANRFAPLERTRVAHCSFVYVGRGMLEHVKVGRFVN